MGAADALLGSIILSLATLFLLGISGGALSQTAKLRRGLKTMTIGGMAILAGIVIGRFFKMA
jgi:VIT1/CCC1 family predicted Fe2+/Mn2+ transporter